MGTLSPKYLAKSANLSLEKTSQENTVIGQSYF